MREAGAPAVNVLSVNEFSRWFPGKCEILHCGKRSVQIDCHSDHGYSRAKTCDSVLRAIGEICLEGDWVARG